MKSQPNRNYSSDDVVMTPDALAEAIVRHFAPTGRCLDPAKGRGAFLQYLPSGSDWCESTEGVDFMQWTKHVDWIVTNPPWSQMRAFIRKGMEVADNVVYLLTINHLWTKARVRDVQQAGFHLAELLTIIPYPSSFPPSGFQLGVAHLKRGPGPGWVKYGTLKWVDA